MAELRTIQRLVNLSGYPDIKVFIGDDDDLWIEQADDNDIAININDAELLIAAIRKVIPTPNKE